MDFQLNQLKLNTNRATFALEKKTIISIFKFINELKTDRFGDRQSRRTPSFLIRYVTRIRILMRALTDP